MSSARYVLPLALFVSFSSGADTQTPSLDLGPVSVKPVASPLPDSWAQGPFIEIYVRGYKDTNGDGRGDLQGVIEKLDYIKSVGFTGIWLMPIFDSFDRNHGYSVKNYRAVEPAYGDTQDVQRLVEEAHKRGIGLILDYVPNHAASNHPLFVESAEKNSPYRDWFVWSDEKPEGWSGYTGEPWHERNGSWYYGVYDSIMPDFNWHNPAVLDFHLNNLKYWLNFGVDGFRIDAAGPLVEKGPLAWVNLPESMKITNRFLDTLKLYPGAKFQVCEAPSEAAGYATDKACGSAFAFGLQNAIIRSAQLGRIDKDLISYLDKMPVERLATFLSNHDSFPGVRLYNQMSGDMKDYRLAVATQYLLPGVPFTFYGEEVGVGLATDATGGLDEQIRTTMAWTGEDTIKSENGETILTSGGFTALKPGFERRLFRHPPANRQQFNVASQEKDPDSLLNFYRRVIALRKATPELVNGKYRRIEAQTVVRGKPSANVDGSVFTFVRELNGEEVLVAINYSMTAAKISFSVAGTPSPLWSETGTQLHVAPKGRKQLQIPAKSFAVFKLKGV